MAEQLGKAVLREDVETVRRLIEEGADPCALNKKGLCALHLAAREGNPEVLAAVLESPAIFINTKDRDSGFTALHHAISGCLGDPSIVRQVMSVKDCDIAATDKDGNNALHWAATLGQTEVAGLLLARGVPREAMNADAETPLHIAIKEGNEETALLLLQRGANPNTKDGQGCSPLHLALSNRLLGVAVETLKNKKFTIAGCVDAEGNTPLHIAAEEGLSNLMIMLQDAGFSADAPNLSGLTPATIIEMQQRQQEEEDKKRSAALQERGQRKRQQEAAAMQQTEVTAFCVAAGIPESIQQIFYKKRYIYVDEAFMTLDEQDLRKMGLGAPERLFFKEAVEKHKKAVRMKEEAEAQLLRKVAERKTMTTRIIAAIVLLVAVIALYVGLEFAAARQRRM